MKPIHIAKLMLPAALLCLLAGWPALADQDPGGPEPKAEAPGPLVERVGGRTWQGDIHWDKGLIQVQAMARTDPAKMGGMARAKLAALKAARYRAFLRLAEVLKSVRVDDSGALGDRAALYRNLGGVLRGAVRGARVEKEEARILPDGRVLGIVRLSLPLKGEKGLTGMAIAAAPRIFEPPKPYTAQPRKKEMPREPAPPVEKKPAAKAEPKPAPKPEPKAVAQPKPPVKEEPKAEPVKKAEQEPKPKIEAKAKPAPKPAVPKAVSKKKTPAKPKPTKSILIKDGKNFVPVKSAYAKYQRKDKYTGLVVSASGLGAKPAMFPLVLDGPSGLEVFGPNHVGKKYAIEKGVVGYAPSVQKALGHERVGKNPLVVKAMKVEGLNKAKLVVSRENALKIFAADKSGGFLQKCGVVIVIN